MLFVRCLCALVAASCLCLTGCSLRTESQPQPSATPLPTASSSAAAANAPSVGEDWALRLVNSQNPLPEDFAPKTTAMPGYDERLFDARAADSLCQLLEAAQQDGCPLYLVSGYRSIERQTALFARKTRFYLDQGLTQAQAEEKASQLVARPGTSEHNLGLAADLVSADWYSSHSDLTADFDTTPAFAWLSQHAADYGFILRYPKDKQAITGVDYEPWHYRYVGREAALAITSAGLTLEEYHAQHP